MNKPTYMPRRTSSAQIADQLRLQLSNGHYAPGQRYYSNSTLAQEFGISPPTANQIIGELCRDGLLSRRNGSGTYVTGKALTQSMVTYGLLLGIDLHNADSYGNISYGILASFERECAIQGRKALLINTYDSNCLTRLASLIDTGLDGVFVAPSGRQDPCLQKALAMLRAQASPIPIAYWDASGERLEAGDIRIGFDDVQCGRTATDHLLSLGHHRIALVGRDSDDLWGKLRTDGYHEALTKAKIPKRQRVVETISRDDLRPSSLIGLLRNLQKQGVTAIVATNDALAKEVMLAGRSVDMRFPEHFSITGVDNLKEAHVMGLTTIDRPADVLCRASLLGLEQKRQGSADESSDTTLMCPLIIRETTAHPPQ